MTPLTESVGRSFSEYTGLSASALKMLALVSMTLDHIGKILLPQILILQILGRLAFPIFAYLIAESCHFTRSLRRYWLRMTAVGLVCQLVLYISQRSLYQCILITFAGSVCIIAAVRRADAQTNLPRRRGYTAAAVALTALAAWLSEGLPILLPNTNYSIDYGFLGILLPVLIYLGRTPRQKWLLAAGGLTALAIQYGGIQWWAPAALVPLALYNGRRGKYRAKYFFYLYYPLHLALLWLLHQWLQ